MRPASDRFLSTVRASHTMTARARLCLTYQTGIDPDGESLTIGGGDVVLDATADVWSTLTLTTDGTNRWPYGGDLSLGPYGNEIFVERGVQYGNGVTEWVSLGYHQIRELDQDNPPDGPIVLSATDRMKGIIAAGLLTPRQFVPTDTFGAVVSSLVLDVYPDATIEWDDATDLEPIGRSIVVESDRFATLTDVVKSRGKIAYWDHRGVLVIKDLPDSTVPVGDITSGSGGVLVAMSRKLSREGVYNAVVATGEATDELPTARGVAVNNNPLSPTYFYGRFGQEPRYYSSPLLSNDSEATKAAQTILDKGSGLPYNVNFTTICNPAYEPYDAITVKYTNKRPAEIHVIETLTIPLLAADAMTGTTREQTA